jgi:S1-C subfamily serine protease
VFFGTKLRDRSDGHIQPAAYVSDMSGVRTRLLPLGHAADAHRSLFRLRLTWITGLVIGALLAVGCGGKRSTSPSTAPVVTSGSSAPALERQFVAVVRQIQPAVAQIQTDGGRGSGVVCDGKEDIVTNAHMVAGASSLPVTLADGRRFTARLVGSYAPDDLAVVSIGAGQVQSGGPAEKSGISVSDMIEVIDGKRVGRLDDLAGALARMRPGRAVKVSVTPPDGTSSTDTVTLGQLPGS